MAQGEAVNFDCAVAPEACISVCTYFIQHSENIQINLG